MKKAPLVGIVALGIAFANHTLLYRTLWPLFFYAGFPGVVTSLFITGGHGGTIAQERIAPVAEIAINTVFYFALLLCAVKLSKSLRS